MICNVIRQQASIVDNVASDLCGIGLGELDPTVSWYKDHDKFIEAYKKMLEELKNGRVSLEELYCNKHMVELIQYLFGAEVDGFVSEYIYSVGDYIACLELYTKPKEVIEVVGVYE